MEINLQGGVRPQTLPVAKKADLPVITTAQSESGSLPQPDIIGGGNDLEAQRYERLAKAAEGFFKDVFAVSDARFTIFKDSSGQYITRYTSLRDGRVTYIPEPNMLQYMESRRAQREAILNINA